MTRQKRIILTFLAAILLVGVGVVQVPLDYQRYKDTTSGLMPVDPFRTKSKQGNNLLFDLPLQFFGAAAVGMREAVASLLWVRAAEFFHTGQYEAILPIVRLVTWLDPHQIEVYTTGAWHLDYNFTDSEERADRRYIAPAIKLLREGIENNPDVYDLYFELAWTHYFQKAKKYDKAAYWMEQAMKHPAKDPNTGREIPRPGFVDRMLAHTYERAGMFDKAREQWYACIERAQKLEHANEPNTSDFQEVIIAKKNLGDFLLRQGWRNGNMAAYEEGIEVLSSIDDGMPEFYRAALARVKKSYQELVASGKAPMDTKPPVDAKFTVEWKKIKPRVLMLQGTMDLVPATAYKGLASEPYTQWWEKEYLGRPADQRPGWRDGCRLRIIICDADYDYWNITEPEEFNWETDPNQTVLIDEVSARNGKFQIKIDMSKDQDIYPLAKDKYKIVIWYNPQEGPDYVQDRIGWRGEGMTDKNHLNKTKLPGYNILFKEIILRRSDII